MREIELKFKVDNLKDIITYLHNQNCEIIPAKHQHDIIYVKDLSNVKSGAVGSTWLRVRKTDDVVELNYKKQGMSHAESEEIEFEVSSFEKANEFLKALGYYEWVQVKKVRQYSEYHGYNICIDEVDQLGNFVEVELLTDDERADHEKQLMTIAREIGINTDNIVKSHYDTMIAERQKGNL